MNLHIFNPEHDIALASNLAIFTPPLAGRRFRSELSHLPIIWAEAGDFVLVPDVEIAANKARSLPFDVSKVRFISKTQLSALPFQQLKVQPWGWDRAVCQQLLHSGLPASLLPTDRYLQSIRTFSHRCWAAQHLLTPICNSFPKGTIGKSFYVNYTDFFSTVLHAPHDWVIKEPFSSSGRGVRFVSREHLQTLITNPSFCGWIKKVSAMQGGLLCEPHYENIFDFAMEFHADKGHGIRYLGLSCFTTEKGTFVGSLIDTEEEKRKRLARWVHLSLIDDIRQMIIDLLTPVWNTNFEGPFGIDMMLVKVGTEIKVHPCVELNLRRTMGHVALALESFAPAKFVVADTQAGYEVRIVR